MIYKRLFLLLALFGLLALAACSSSGGSEPTAESIAEPTTETASEQPENELPIEEEAIEELTAADCPEATAGAHQLIAAAQGICFLYPDNYDVMQAEDGSLTLYVKSPLNTEAPLATVRIEAVNGRSIQEIIPDYPSDAELAAMTFLTIDLGGEQAMVLDTLPGQDINRHIIAMHNDRIVDIMIARIGPEYGEVGEQAESLHQMMTDSFQFITIEPEATLVAGPECPDAPVGTTLFTNTEDGFCLLLPDGYTVDDSLTTENGGGETAVYVDSLMDSAHARLFITVDAANGRSLEDVTADKQAEFSDFEVMFSFGYMLDGVPANQFEQLPGQDLNRQVVLVHNGRFYTLTFIPDDPEMGDAYTEMQTLYDTVMDSFSFLEES